MTTVVDQAAVTVLVAEDEAQLRTLVVKTLQQRGYQTLSATTGTDAIRISDEYPGRIDLVVTDMVMPQMGGRELAGKLAQTRPGLKVIYVSGYTKDSAIRSGLLESGEVFLQKPFALSELATLVRNLLKEK